jgi:predicted amidohydrolase
MRIACFQGPRDAGTPAQNLARLEAVAIQVRAEGADILIAPEMFLTGYALGPEAVASVSEPLDGPSVTEARRIASANGLALVFGMPERGVDGNIYNTAIAIGRNGDLLATYRKTHLYGDVDRTQFSQGSALPQPFDLGGFRTALLICYDIEFPEVARSLALDGVQLIIAPTAVMKPYDFVPRTLVPARAFENQLFVAYVNRCGTEADFDYCGLSCVVGPDGIDRVRAGPDEELVFTDIDIAEIELSRRDNPYLQDRRPELYGRVFDRNK